MSRVYSGILNDFADAVFAIEDMDLKVHRSVHYRDWQMSFAASLTVFTEGGGFVANTEIVDRDIDLLYTKSTAWLRNVYQELKEWK